jgi:hypothetical protein
VPARCHRGCYKKLDDAGHGRGGDSALRFPDRMGGKN